VGGDPCLAEPAVDPRRPGPELHQVVAQVLHHEPVAVVGHQHGADETVVVVDGDEVHQAVVDLFGRGAAQDLLGGWHGPSSVVGVGGTGNRGHTAIPRET